MGVMPIPFSSIVEYSKIYEVGDFDEFNYVIRQMDDAYIKSHGERDSGTTKTSS